MSKQADAKKQQGYTRAAPNCGGCAHFQSEMIKRPGWGGVGTYTDEKALRCGMGGFKVNKTAWCEGFVRQSVNVSKGK